MFNAAAIAFPLLASACGEVARAPSAHCEDIEPGVVTLIGEDSLTVYSKPDSSAGEWSTLAPGNSVEIAARTAEGWLGFDPGVAQAGNSGSFRYRWIAPGGAYDLQGDPVGLDVMWGPSPDVAYAMTFEPVAIYLEPDSLSTVIDHLPGASAAAIELAIAGWYEVDPSDGPSPTTMPGWIRNDAVSINGEIPRETILQDN
jgi:hypothetical protein